jgi:hypothetical protein
MLPRQQSAPITQRLIHADVVRKQNEHDTILLNLIISSFVIGLITLIDYVDFKKYYSSQDWIIELNNSVGKDSILISRMYVIRIMLKRIKFAAKKGIIRLKIRLIMN